MSKQFYTQYGHAGSNYSKYTNNKDLAKLIREFIKKDNELSQCKWSVTSNYLEINVSLIEAPQQALSEKCLEKYRKINSEEYEIQYVGGDDDRLSEYGKKIINKVNDFVLSYHYDDSDGRIDYFDTNFYFYSNVGKYNKPFRVVEKTPSKNRVEKHIEPVEAGAVKIIGYSEKSLAIIGDTKPIKDTLKAIGCKYNTKLSCGKGWVISKSKEQLLRKTLQLS